METIVKTPELEYALAAGRALGDLKKPGAPTDLVVIPTGYKAEAVEKLIEPYLEKPRRVQANVKLTTLESFIRYVKDFKGRDTRIFAHVEPKTEPTFTAIIDYHASVGEMGSVPAWCEHRAVYDCNFTPEWERWMVKDRTKMTQGEFAILLEENQALVINPPGAELLELVSDLYAKTDITCNQLIRLNNGRTRLSYDEQVELKGSVTTQAGTIEFPSVLVVGIAPFVGGPSYKISCRLKYRLENRRLTFWFEAIDVHLVLQECVTAIMNEIKEKLAIEPLLGTP